MDIDRYLERIGYEGHGYNDLTSLRELSLAHIMAVPFENLDIHLGIPISLVVEDICDKVVNRHRGGYCFELNFLFGTLLRHLGFEVKFISARVFGAEYEGTEFDHLTLTVTLGEETYLVDVGFGDGFYLPMNLNSDATAEFAQRTFRISAVDDSYILECSKSNGFDKGLKFDLTPRQIRDFQSMNDFHSGDPRSWYVQELVVTRATPTGRIGLVGRRRTERIGAHIEKRELSDSEYIETLINDFGLDIPYIPTPKASKMALRLRRKWQIAISRAHRFYQFVLRQFKRRNI